jgi:hypothetical protein
MKLNCRWAETRYGVFHRRTEHELFCRIELDPAEQAAYERSDLGEKPVCDYRSHGLPMETRLKSLIAGETRFGSEDRAYLEEIERQVVGAADELAEALAVVERRENGI